MVSCVVGLPRWCLRYLMNKTLNVNVVTINAPMPVFEEKEIEHE